MRVIVCGCRDFCDNNLLFQTLDGILSNFDDVEIISGHATGADKIGEEYAKSRGLKCAVFKAEWDKYGRAAGPIRNKQMLYYAMEDHPLVIAFWDGKSRGTKNMIDIAKKVNVATKIILYERGRMTE